MASRICCWSSAAKTRGAPDAPFVNTAESLVSSGLVELGMSYGLWLAIVEAVQSPALASAAYRMGERAAPAERLGANKSYGPGHETVAEKFVPVLSTAVADRLWVPLRVRRCSVVRR